MTRTSESERKRGRKSCRINRSTNKRLLESKQQSWKREGRIWAKEREDSSNIDPSSKESEPNLLEKREQVRRGCSSRPENRMSRPCSNSRCIPQ